MLTGMRYSHWVEQTDCCFLVLPLKDRIVSDLTSPSAIVSALLVNRPRRVRRIDLTRERVERDSFACGTSLSSVVWSLALREAPREQIAGCKPDTVFRISHWPQFGLWESDPALLRMAALYSRTPATVTFGATLLGVPGAQVKAFLSACAATGIAIDDLDGDDRAQGLALARGWPWPARRLTELRGGLGVRPDHNTAGEAVRWAR